MRGSRAIFYGLHRFYVAGVPAGRILNLALVGLALVWATGRLPGHWWGTGIWLGLLIAYIVVGALYRRADYVQFEDQTVPPLHGQPLQTDEKLAIHATGQFTVEGRYQRFTCLPGFFRTFATGEHAVLCLVRPRTWGLLARRPHDETGMWYAFVEPNAISRLRWGRLRFGNHVAPAIAVDYTSTIPAKGKRKREQERPEVLYLTFHDQADGQRLFADLLHTAPAGAGGEAEPAAR